MLLSLFPPNNSSKKIKKKLWNITFSSIDLVDNLFHKGRHQQTQEKILRRIKPSREITTPSMSVTANRSVGITARANSARSVEKCIRTDGPKARGHVTRERGGP